MPSPTVSSNHIMEVFNMRATLNIPDELISEVQKLSGEKSKTKAITIAIEEFIRAAKDQRIDCSQGKS